MLAGEAARLAIVECLRPTGAETLPTLAGENVFDSIAASINDIDEDMRYVPTVAVYTREATVDRRGERYSDNNGRVVLEIVCDLSVIVDDEEGGGPPITAPMAATDATARLALAALVAQVRRILEFDPAGALFRSAIKGIDRIDEETMSVPDFGLDYQRVVIRLTCAVEDDGYIVAGDLPEPLKKLRDALPAGSYAKAKLTALGEMFAAIVVVPLQSVAIYDADAPPPDGDPVAIEEDLDQ